MPKVVSSITTPTKPRSSFSVYIVLLIHLQLFFASTSATSLFSRLIFFSMLTLRFVDFRQTLLFIFEAELCEAENRDGITLRDWVSHQGQQDFAAFPIINIFLRLMTFYRSLNIAFRAVLRFIGLLIFVKKLHRKNVSIAELFEQQCEKSPNKACMVFEGREWTFKEVNIMGTLKILIITTDVITTKKSLYVQDQWL